MVPKNRLDNLDLPRLLPTSIYAKTYLGLCFGSSHLSDSDLFPSSYCWLASIFGPQARLAEKKQISLKEKNVSVESHAP